MIELLKRFLHELVFRNFFIALCAASMVYATFILNNLPLRFTHFTVFLSCATFLLYNFHIYSFRMNYTGIKNLLTSVDAINISWPRKIMLLLVFLILLTEFFFLSEKVLLWLIPLSVLSILYSVPLWGIKRKVRIRESFLVKMPLLAAVWSLSTVIIPLAEQNISLNNPFVYEQVGCRFFFVFALCIPFEIRDLEVDRKENVRTLPYVFGINRTKLLGTVLIIAEIIIHHFMTIDNGLILALDLSSIFALVWIFVERQKRESYFYKLIVDGTMVLRFLFLYFVITCL